MARPLVRGLPRAILCTARRGPSTAHPEAVASGAISCSTLRTPCARAPAIPSRATQARTSNTANKASCMPSHAKFAQAEVVFASSRAVRAWRVSTLPPSRLLAHRQSERLELPSPTRQAAAAPSGERTARRLRLPPPTARPTRAYSCGEKPTEQASTRPRAPRCQPTGTPLGPPQRRPGLMFPASHISRWPPP